MAQDGVDVSGVERVVDGSQQVLLFHRTNITQPLGCAIEGSDLRPHPSGQGWVVRRAPDVGVGVGLDARLVAVVDPVVRRDGGASTAWPLYAA